MGRSEVSDLTVLFIVTKAMLVWVLFLKTKFNGQDPPSASEWPMSVCGVRLQTDLGCNSIKMALNIGGLQEVELSYLGWTGGTVCDPGRLHFCWKAGSKATELPEFMRVSGTPQASDYKAVE